MKESRSVRVFLINLSKGGSTRAAKEENMMRLLLTALLFWSFSATVWADDPVYFSDPNLEFAVQRQLHIWDRDVTSTDMLTLTNLRAVACGITDLTGLEYATNLQGLRLSRNDLTDVSVLSGLGNLRELWLNWNEISDLSSLSSLTLLEKVILHYNQIRSVAPLSALHNLQTLDIENNQVADISPLSELTHLQVLYLQRNQISDISVLSSFPDLEILRLDRNQISDLSALSGLSDLQILFVQDNRISELSPLLGLTNLTRLNLWLNPLDPEAYCSDLQTILDNNPGIDLAYSFNNAPPAAVIASDGTYSDRVHVAWEPVYNGPMYTSYYCVFRALSSGGALTAVSEWQTSLSFDDATAEPETEYVYSVKVARDRVGSTAGTYSISDTGWRRADSGPGSTRILHVDGDAGGLNDGSCWADAYTYLQDALADVNTLDKPVEIRVAQGVYRPDRGKGQKSGDVNATFSLIDGVTIRGGYAGIGAADPNARDVAAYETILSGDLDGNDEPNFVNYENNAQAVVTSTFNDITAMLDGVTVTAGCGWSGPGLSCYGSDVTVLNCTFTANQSIGREGGYGGAVYASEGRPTFTHCDFVGNWAMAEGGAIWSQSDGEITLIDCSFTGNYAKYRGGAISSYTGTVEGTGCVFLGNVVGDKGGAIYGYHTVHILTDCRFHDNTAEDGGGGIYHLVNDMFVTGCTFSGNRAYEGGGIYNDSPRTVTVTNSLLAGNLATGWGGGMFNWCDSSPLLTNCTFADNRAAEGAGIAAGLPVLVNCIVWSQESNAQALLALGDGPVVSYSCIQGGWPGTCNIDADPCFAAPGAWDPNGTPDDPNDDVWLEGDYHLKSAAGRWDPTAKRWVKDDVTSPCVDAGDRNTPVDAEPLPNGGLINMGVYGGTVEAGKSELSPTSQTSCYVFDAKRSTLLQEGGFAGVHWPHTIEGQFRLAIDYAAGSASFLSVDAIGTYDGPPTRTLDVGEALNLTGLIDSVGRDGSIRFTGQTTNESAVALTLTFEGDLVHLVGGTTPPAGSADFFVLNLDAYAQRQ